VDNLLENGHYEDRGRERERERWWNDIKTSVTKVGCEFGMRTDLTHDHVQRRALLAVFNLLVSSESQVL
jgi:hypothetical protein